MMLDVERETASGEIDLRQELRISEIFYSLQGEGRQAGRPCLFLRLAGCNLSCPWCDTPYTWKPGAFGPADRQPYTLGRLLELAAEHAAPLVEVTGGEPLLQPATPDLLRALCDEGYEVLLDTSGSLPLDPVDPRVTVLMDLKCPSSGQTAAMRWENLALLKPGDEVRFVIGDRDDYEWAEDVLAEHRLSERVRVVFSPVTPVELHLREWDLPRELAAWMLARRSRGVLQLQLHRLLWPEALRGTEEGYRG